MFLIFNGKENGMKHLCALELYPLPKPHANLRRTSDVRMESEAEYRELRRRCHFKLYKVRH